MARIIVPREVKGARAVPDQLRESLYQDLEWVEASLTREFNLPAGNISRYVVFGTTAAERYLHPAVLILAARLFGAERQRYLPLACVVEFIHLAASTHCKVGDTPALPVLVGDYLYSKFFQYLSRNQGLCWLTPLAQAICTVQEGGMQRLEWESHPSREERLKVVGKEWAVLPGKAASIGGEVAGTSTADVQRLADFGWRLGMTWGLASEKAIQEAEVYRRSCRQVLALLPDKPERQLLVQLVEQVGLNEMETGQVLVV